MRKLLTVLDVKPENRLLFVTVNFAFFTSGLAAIMLGAVLPYILSNNQLSYTQGGLLLSMHQAGNLSAVLIAGFLPFVLGRKVSTLILTIFSIIGLAFIVLANNFIILLVAFAMTGIGRGTFGNTCNVVIADVANNKTPAMNILHSIFAIGAFMSPAIVFVSIRVADWKMSLLTAAILVAIAWMLILRSNMPNLTEREQDSSEKSGRDLSFLKKAWFWAPTMLLFFYLAVEASIIGWFVSYFIEVGVLPGVMAGFVPSMVWFTMIVGRISSALISKHIKRKNFMLLFFALGATICFLGLMVSRSALPCVIFLIGTGLCMAGIYPTTMATMKGVTSSVSVGFTIAIASFGSILMPGIIGALADARGLANAIALLVFALIGLFAMVLFKMAVDKKEGKYETHPKS